MDQPANSSPWLALLIWIFTATICGALLLARLKPRSFSSAQRKKFVRFAAWGMAGLFAIVLIKLLNATGSLAASAGIAMMLSLMWIGIWRVYRSIFKAVY